EPPLGVRIKINFDAAFDRVHSRLKRGVVAKNALGKVVASRSIIHADGNETVSFELKGEGLVLARKDQLEIDDRE
ncbi:hypothetical protein Gorai_007354, partial [Gossypium raimondii]|nr:hypothetical protein [Gossypium raimondii]